MALSSPPHFRTSRSGGIRQRLHEINLGMRRRHVIEHSGLVVDGKAQVADETRFLLLAQEVPQVEVVEQFRALRARATRPPICRRGSRAPCRST